MKKYMFILAAMVIGFTVMADVKPEPAQVQIQKTESLIPMYAYIGYYLHPGSAYGEFMVGTSSVVSSVVTYTVQFGGHTNGTYYFTVYSDRSEWSIFPNAAAGRAVIVAVSPQSDGTYDYTAAIGSEIEW